MFHSSEAPAKFGKFEFRRVTGRGDDHSRVAVSFVQGGEELEIVEAPEKQTALAPEYWHCIEEGIRLAWLESGQGNIGGTVKVLSAVNVTGESTPVGLRECARGATLRALGLESLAPNPGVGIET